MAKPGLFVVSALFLISTTPVLPQERVTISPRSRQQQPAAILTKTTLRSDVRLVQIPVMVTDPQGKPLTELPRDAFRVFEDDVERPISTFSMSDAPISAMLVFDTSRSMKSRIADARTAVSQFLETRLPEDEFALVRFSDQPKVLSSFTRDVGEISRLLTFVEPHGWTALYDAVCLGTHQVRKAHNQRKVVVVFSDGGDNNSRYSETELIRMLREADVQVYAVGMFERPRSLERMAEETGGSAMWVHKLDELPAAVETLSRQIRNEYLIGYNPELVQNDGKYHRIRVDVQPPAGLQRVRASWRHGYLAPGD